jgi:hypothetical protein
MLVETVDQFGGMSYLSINGGSLVIAQSER